jgi:hypothetical protein
MIMTDQDLSQMDVDAIWSAPMTSKWANGRILTSGPKIWAQKQKAGSQRSEFSKHSSGLWLDWFGDIGTRGCDGWICCGYIRFADSLKFQWVPL